VRITIDARRHTHLGRRVALGAAALLVAGAGVATASSPPTSPPTGTAGPSDCPAVSEEAEAAGSEPPTGSESATATEPVANTAPAATEATATMAPTASEAAAAGPFVQVVETDEYGTVLVDSACRALYMFESDTDGESTCFDECAEAWPPLFVSDDTVPPVADELDPSLLSIVEHPDGPMLKYGDWPLYYFVEDSGPGQFNGQGVDAFGGLWWLVAPDGTPVETQEEGEVTATTTAADDTGY
jgi:predicted lipoprotein with Yx(FWY)xxD motif